MERLTKRDLVNGIPVCYPKNDSGLGEMVLKSDPYRKIVEKLKEYEDLEEQCIKETSWDLTTLLRKWKEFFPCMVGDTVYAYCSEFGILPYTVDCIVLDQKITYQCSSYSEPIGDFPSECLDEIEPDISDFGKTVFLTQAEAEEALKRMEGKNEQ